MDIIVKVAGEQEKEDWNKVVDGSLHGTIFHTWEWLKIVEKHTEYKFYPIIGYIDEGTKPIAVLPVFSKRRFLIRTVLSPPNKTAMPYLGPVFSGFEELKQNKKEGLLTDFIEKSNDIIKSLKPQYSCITLPPGFIDTRIFSQLGYAVEPKYNYTIDLTMGSENIFKGFTKNLRQSINSAEKKGVVVEKGGEKELRGIYGFLNENYKKQGKRLPISLEYTLDIYKAFYPDHMNIFVAKQGDEIHGGMVDLQYKSKAYSWIGNTKNPNSKYDINELIQWRAIQLGCNDGLKEYEIIGANTARLSPFKTKFNPDLSVYFNATKYSSGWVKIPEFAYKNIIKPVEGMLPMKAVMKR